MRSVSRILMAFLFLPALLLSGCLGDDASPAAPEPAHDRGATPMSAGGAPAPAPDPPPGSETCDDHMVFAFYQNGTWSDRVVEETFDVPAGTTNLSLFLTMGDHAVVEYEARVTDSDQRAWYDVRYVGYSVPHAQGSALREGEWGDVIEEPTPQAGTHTFRLAHKGPVEDLSYVVIATVCATPAA